MLKHLQEKWKVSGRELLVVLLVFAVTGTTTAWVSRSAPGWLGLGPEAHAAARWGLRLFILLVGYPVILLIVAFLFGQFPFFWRFQKRLLQRFGLRKR
ncbi:MAG TPA: DUF6787 family protein [Chitinophagaceae bacterium]|jgi:hypothetical protein|nr:DUF6787 family protein [Chitinophagaceae bacterium]